MIVTDKTQHMELRKLHKPIDTSPLDTTIDTISHAMTTVIGPATPYSILV